jgi:hypothetical protein
LKTASGQPTSTPTDIVTSSSFPSGQPTSRPFSGPSRTPSSQPSAQPLSRPSSQPSNRPSRQPTSLPTQQPFSLPTGQPTQNPVEHPTGQPTSIPTSPTSQPSSQPIAKPTAQPFSHPSGQPSTSPSKKPSAQPSSIPTGHPSHCPHSLPTSQPSRSPSSRPSFSPSNQPTARPSRAPSSQPTRRPTNQPTSHPSRLPSSQPTSQPSQPSSQPTSMPTKKPSNQPTSVPSSQPFSCPSNLPSGQPSSQPTNPTSQPSALPTSQPSRQPSSRPTGQPSARPSRQPSTQPSTKPTGQPSRQPSSRPTIQPSSHPSMVPSAQPSRRPSVQPSGRPSIQPSGQPTSRPTHPTSQPSSRPSGQPLAHPSGAPTVQPSSHPSESPSSKPSGQPTAQPILHPTATPTRPTIHNTSQPTSFPTLLPISLPSSQPSVSPSQWPSGEPTSLPSGRPSTHFPTSMPTSPTSKPSMQPSTQPTSQPSRQPLALPSAQPSALPSNRPTSQPSSQPSSSPSGLPTAQPTVVPSTQPSRSPTRTPSTRPTTQPSTRPSSQPTNRPSLQPFSRPSSTPSTQPSASPTVQFANITFMAEFAWDASYLRISFTQANSFVDSLDYYELVPCDYLFLFPCSENSTCQVFDSTTIHVSVFAKDQCASPGDKVILVNPVALFGNVLIVGSNSALISAPTSLSPPVIVLNVPQALSSCSPLAFDLTTSFGNAGRSWNTISISVQTVPSTSMALTLQTFIQSKYQVVGTPPQFSPPLSIPANYFIENVDYHFTVGMCNFLGACSSDVKIVKIISTFVPSITVDGITIRTLKRSQSLLVTTTTQPITCNNSFFDASFLQYQWTFLKQDQSKLNSIVSVSADNSKFLLDPFTLSANQSYFVSVVVIYKSITVISSQIKVIVPLGKLIPVLSNSGNSLQVMMKAGETIRLNASQSYDEDSNRALGTGIAAGLSFQWKCVSSAECLTVFDATILTNSLNQPILTLKAGANSGNNITSFTLTLSDSKTKRIVTEIITVLVLPPIYPTIALSSNAINNKINPGQNLQLTAEVTVPTAARGNISWSVMDLDLDLKTIALTAVSDSVSSGESIKYLSLSPNSLVAGLSYQFQLKCQLANSVQSTSSLIVLVNAPPAPGSFLLSRLSGIELKDEFTFSCNDWSDMDLPLYYQFSYISPTGSNLVIQSSSTQSYSKTVLPSPGSTSDNRNVICQADIFDSFAANSTVYSTVVVNPLPGPNISTLITDSIDPSQAVNSDDLIRNTNIAISLLNAQQNCSLAPDCGLLHRLPCSSTSHTCGVCKATFFSSTAGDSNELCVQTLPTIDKTKLKTCHLSCSGLGTCSFYSQRTAEAVDTCFEGDLSCYSACSCPVGFKLSAYCELSDEEMNQMIHLRDLVVERIVSNAYAQHPTQLAISSWMNNVWEVSQVSRELSSQSLSSLLSLSNFALQKVKTEGYNTRNTLQSFLDGVDSLSSAVPFVDFTNSQLKAPDTGSIIVSTVKNYSNLILNEMVPGQFPTKTLKKNFRCHSEHYKLGNNHKFSAAMNSRQLSFALAENITLSLLQSLSEKALNEPITKLIIPASANGQTSSFQFSTISMSSRVYQYPTATTDPLSLSFSSLPCSDLNHCQAHVSMESDNDGQRVVYPATNITVKCLINDFTNHTVTCPNHRNYTITCHGKLKNVLFQCPESSYQPLCNSVTGNTASNKECSTNVMGANSISCTCPVLSSALGSFTTLTPAVTLNSPTDVTYLSLLESVEENFLTTILSADDLNNHSIARSIVALITVGLLVLGIIVGMAVGHYLDAKEKKKILAEETVEKNNNNMNISQQKMITEENELSESENLILLSQQSLPAIVSTAENEEKNTFFSKKIVEEEKKFHRWFGIVYYFSSHFPRILRVVSLASNIIIMLFVQSLTYNYTNGDDGSCEKLSSEAACLVPKSNYGTGDSKCEWNPVDFGLCEYVQPENQFEIMLFVAIFSGLISAPVAMMMDWLIHHILAAPTSSESYFARNLSLRKLGKVENAETELAIFPVTNEKTNKNNITQSSEEVDDLVEKDVNDLLNELLDYQKTITDPVHKEEFDREFLIFHFFFFLILLIFYYYFRSLGIR